MKNKVHWVSLAISLAAIILSVYLLISKEQKILYVDSAKLVNGYKGMEVARKDYQKKTAAWKANIDTLMNEVQQEIVKFEKESQKMTAKERELTKQLIQTKQQQFADYQKAINQKAGQEDSQMTKKVLDEINAYIKEYGKKNNCKIILAATDYGNIAYADEGLDITEVVLEGLNKKYSGQ
jgi:outer membrane protein